MAPPSAFPAPWLSLSRVSPTIYEVGFQFTTCEAESRWILGFFAAVSFSCTVDGFAQGQLWETTMFLPVC